ncbi:hypothetical protein D0T25_23770 [Duganella sp. BJB488]|uniref:hypothetical protein n=1 Tax=unclassified Duganella TaxID=2636909 RepID=UPI000E34E6CA|nr:MULTISPECIES: hypothetical protein [unclassified Duganella]RFP13124.1 hypothetical protein D0T26_22780 [Duganella sp. BJB489]RFP17112.1 hypothetical protein D0T25_23770 [Duganella sp. BJB488]RFP31669.1 hypothetical protein D0T24_24945 [Duganella sp. BJB480]
MPIQQKQKYSEMERKAGGKYLRELTGSIAVYVVLLIASLTYGPAMDSGSLKTAALACPVIGFFLMIWAVARQVGRMDEYQRIVMLETFTLAAAVTVGVTFTYGFLEAAGYPRLSMFTVWGVMGASWLVIGLFRRWTMDR